jgi:hypothetical protein
MKLRVPDQLNSDQLCRDQRLQSGPISLRQPGQSGWFIRLVTGVRRRSAALTSDVLWKAMAMLMTVASCSAEDVSARLRDETILQAGADVMNDREFRSVRRLVLEQPVATDIDKGFLASSFAWVSGKLRQGFEYVGDFFDWLFRGIRSGPTSRPASPIPASEAKSVLPNFDGLSKLTQVLISILIIAILVTLLAMTVRALDAKNRSRPLRPDAANLLLSDLAAPPGELPSSTYETRALQLAADGNFRGAIRELLIGSMSWIERAELIRHRKGLTNRDYLRAVSKQPDCREAWLTTASQFELVYFGRRPATCQMFDACLSGFQGAFREESPTSVA